MYAVLSSFAQAAMFPKKFVDTHVPATGRKSWELQNMNGTSGSGIGSDRKVSSTASGSVHRSSPPEYVAQAPDFFHEGRYFKI